MVVIGKEQSLWWGLYITVQSSIHIDEDVTNNDVVTNDLDEHVTNDCYEEEVGDDQNETHGETALVDCVDDGLESDLKYKNWKKTFGNKYFLKLARLQMRAHKFLCDPKQLSCRPWAVKAGPRMARVVTDQKLAQLQIFVTSNNKIVEIFSSVIASLEFSQKSSNQSCHHK